MKRFTLLALSLLSVHNIWAQQCPPNIDFESGNFSGWECYTGNVSAAGGTNNFILMPSLPAPGRHEIISAYTQPALDPYGNFPMLCPYGGNFSVKLGNNTAGSEAEALSYTFQVPALADSFSITYYYAVVFENPWHAPVEKPRFFVSAYDALTGDVINCSSYDYVADDNIPGFLPSPVKPGVWYKKWSPVSIVLAGMAGRSVKLEFKVADCANGGHFGYAYIDVGSNCTSTLTTASWCAATNAVVLNAPYGYQSYTWYNEDYSVVFGHQQSVTISPPLPANARYHVDMIPYPGYGCRDTLDAIAVPAAVPDTPVAASDYFFCQLAASTPLTAQSLSDHELLWYDAATGGAGSVAAPAPATETAGTFDYYVSQKKLFGCESPRKKITVTVGPSPVAAFTINNNRQCEDNNRFVFTSTSSNLHNSVFTWDFGNGQVISSSDPDATHTFNDSGRFTIKLKVVNPPACFSEAEQTITVMPKPVAAFDYPSVICEKQTPVALTDNSAVPGGTYRITGWQWNINGSWVQQQNPPSFIAGRSGPMPVKLLVTTSEGCRSDTHTVVIPVRYRPVAAFDYKGPLCNNETLRFNDLSYLPGKPNDEFITRWNWQFAGIRHSGMQHPALNLEAGEHRVTLTAETNFGCQSLAADSLLTVQAKPGIALDISDSCVYRSIRYQAIDRLHTIDKWFWDFGNGFYNGSSSVTRTWQKEGDHSLALIGQTIHGCNDTIIRPFTIFGNKALAGKDTVAAMNQPVQLNAHGGPNVQYTWSPATGLNDASVENPVATSDRDQWYELYAVTDKGCESKSRIFIKRYKGPDLYMPNAFTPNGDGKNDAYRVIAVGVQQFTSLTIFNRYGQRVFHTTDYTKGWDGTINGRQQDPGNYVAIVQAVDYNGVKIVRKGNVVLIR